MNTFASTEDQLFKGKYKNIKVPPNTDRQGPLESFNSSYDKSSRVGLFKPQHNKYGHISIPSTCLSLDLTLYGHQLGHPQPRLPWQLCNRECYQADIEHKNYVANGLLIRMAIASSLPCAPIKLRTLSIY